MPRDLDVVVFGATGDTGLVGCCCLYFRGKQLGLSNWAPAARNLNKLQTDVLSRLQDQSPGSDGMKWSEPIQADSSDLESLKRMCERTKCVLTCAGPYTKYGESVVRACVETGTHYVDITGEVDWVIEMQTKYSQEAESKGVAVVSLAGYDSVPADLTTCMAAKCFEKEGERLQRCETFFSAKGGVMPTGTLNTALGELDSAKGAALYRLSCGLLGTAPAPQAAPVPAPTENDWVPASEMPHAMSSLIWSLCPGFSRMARSFTFPHFMAAVNVFTVHHTAAREGYGGLVYREYHALPKGFLSCFGGIPAAIGYSILTGLASLAPVPGFSRAFRKVMGWVNVPLQRQARDFVMNGYSSTGETKVRTIAKSTSGRSRVNVSMKSAYDPGLGFTMLSACAIAASIAKRSETNQPVKSGFNSAVVALGCDPLAEVLRSAGVDIQLRLDR